MELTTMRRMESVSKTGWVMTLLAKKLTQLRERRLHVGFPETHAEREERVLVFVDGPLLEVVHLGDAEVGVVFIVVPFEN
jgi:hypothetical protein